MGNLLSKPTPPSTPSPSPRRPSPRLDEPASPGAISTVSSSVTTTSPTLRSLIEEYFDDSVTVEEMLGHAEVAGMTVSELIVFRRIWMQIHAEQASVELARAQHAPEATPETE